MSPKFDSAQQELIDKIMQELPEELAACVTFEPHEGGDGINLTYPKSWNCTPDFKILNDIVRRYSGTYTNNANLGPYFLIPRPRAKVPVELPDVRKGIVSGANVAAAKADIPKMPAEAKKTTEASKDVSVQQPGASVPVQQSAASVQPKQPSPIDLFISQNCSVCVDFGVNCSPKNDSARRLYCLEVLKLRDMQAHGVLKAKECLIQEKTAMFLQSINGHLEKLANRPVYQKGKPQQQRELHVDGGIKWCWNTAHTYEQAWGDDNKDSKEFADLKAKLAAAKDAGKKGVFVGDFWVFLDGYGKDAILRKKTQDEPRRA